MTIKHILTGVMAASIIGTSTPPAVATTARVQEALVRAFIGEVYETREATPQARRALADAALNYWRNFYARLPLVTPDEQAMIDEHDAFVFTMDPESDNRFYELTSSRAVALGRLHEDVGRCLDDHEALAMVAGAGEAPEAPAWLGVVHCYFNAGFTHSLERADLDGGGVAGDFKMQYFGAMLEVISHEIAPALSRE